ALVLSPGLALPFKIGLEAPGGEDTGARLKALIAAVGRDEAAAVEFEPVNGRVIADLHTELFGAAEVGVDQGLAPTHEKRVGACQVQGARQRGLEVDAVLAHPAPTGG